MARVPYGTPRASLPKTFLDICKHHGETWFRRYKAGTLPAGQRRCLACESEKLEEYSATKREHINARDKRRYHTDETYRRRRLRYARTHYVNKRKMREAVIPLSVQQKRTAQDILRSLGRKKPNERGSEP